MGWSARKYRSTNNKAVQGEQQGQVRQVMLDEGKGEEMLVEEEERVVERCRWTKDRQGGSG